MCGILGKIFLESSAKLDKNRFVEGLSTMYHRGPDGYGVFYNNRVALGHRRLSIIDLSEGGKQPMTSADGKVVLNFNGEIYNYLEIKADLLKKGYQFRTDSDTEVLLYAFYDKGIACLDDLIGMFAFCIYDGRNDTTYLVRDRLGIKPLYFTENKGDVTFASEIKAILQVENRPFERNEMAVSSYMSFRYAILNDTYFEGISSLPAGHFLTIKNGEITETEYWDVADKFQEQAIDKGEEYYIAELRRLLHSAVKYRMIADVPVGSFLSGGVDSSVVAALMSLETENPVNTFTIGFDEEGYNEFEYADMVADRYKTNHREIKLTGKDYLTTMEKLISLKDGPLSVPNEVPLHLMSKELKKYITVVLSGEGADEIFGGYGRLFRSPFDYQRWKNQSKFDFSEEEASQFMLNYHQKYGDKIFDSELDHFYDQYCYTGIEDKIKLLNPPVIQTDYEMRLRDKFHQYFQKIPDAAYENKIMYAFEKVHIVGLLHRVDMTTMGASVEARVPFVDHRVVEFAFTIPLKYKLKWNSDKDYFLSRVLNSSQISENHDTPKYILKKAYEDLLPNEVLYRKKMGFPVPLNNWFGGAFKQYAKEILLDKRTQERGQINSKNIEKWLNADSLKKDHSFAMKIWMLINIELFNRQYFA
jgi:asparagine synthase (glutamine-hydrolysing)